MSHTLDHADIYNPHHAYLQTSETTKTIILIPTLSILTIHLKPQRYTSNTTAFYNRISILNTRITKSSRRTAYLNHTKPSTLLSPSGITIHHASSASRAQPCRIILRYFHFSQRSTKAYILYTKCLLIPDTWERIGREKNEMRDNHGKVVAIDTTDRGLKDAREKGRVPLRASLKTAEAIHDKEK
jgi:hypothetical protein